jgi:hypothetical protein
MADNAKNLVNHWRKDTWIDSLTIILPEDLGSRQMRSKIVGRCLHDLDAQSSENPYKYKQTPLAQSCINSKIH